MQSEVMSMVGLGDPAVAPICQRGVFGFFQELRPEYPDRIRVLTESYAHIKKTLHGILFLFKRPKREPFNYSLDVAEILGTNQAGSALVPEARSVGMSISPLRVAFDSNVWQMAVTPSLANKTEFYANFVTVHDALRRKQIQGFISETVGTLEAIRKLGRKAYFSSIRPKVNVKVVNAAQGQAVLKIDIGTTHDQHPGLHRILEERLQLAIALGIRLMRAPRMAIPVPPLMLDLSVFADEMDVTTVAARDNRWGDVMSTIEQRGVGSGLLRSLQEKAGGRVDDIEEKAFARAVAEWADGDSVAAHVAYGNDVFARKIRARAVGTLRSSTEATASGWS